MRTLALDLGTATGFAYADKPGGSITAGTWHLAADKELRAAKKRGDDRARDVRILRLFDRIKEVGATRIVFEDVLFIGRGTKQGQLWPALRSAAWLQVCTEFRPVPVQTLKKFATGWHNATKEQMGDALRRGHPDLVKKLGKIDDNCVDAVYLLLYDWAH